MADERRVRPAARAGVRSVRRRPRERALRPDSGSWLPGAGPKTSQSPGRPGRTRHSTETPGQEFAYAQPMETPPARRLDAVGADVRAAARARRDGAGAVRAAAPGG